MGPALPLLLACTLAAADEPDAARDKAEAPRPAPVVDPSYTPNPGDRAVLFTPQRDEDGAPADVWAAVSVDVLRTIVQGVMAGTADGEFMEKLEDAKKVVYFENGTAVDLLELKPVETVSNFQGRGGVVAAAVRIVGGEHKGKMFYTNPVHLARFVERPAGAATGTGAAGPRRGAGVKARTKARPKAAAGGKTQDKATADDAAERGPGAASPASKTATAPDPAARAASLLRLAQGLEKSGKTEGAASLYRQVVSGYPKSPQARTAAERLKALAAPR